MFGNFFSDMTRLSDDQRRLLVACGAGAGMAAAYGVPLGGALFAIEVVRGALALRFILPALLCSAVATAAAWTLLPNAPTYKIPAYPGFPCKPALCRCLRIGGRAICGSLRAMCPMGGTQQTVGMARRIVRPIFGLALLGIADP